MSDQSPSEARQAYLETAVRKLEPLFKWCGKPIPAELRVSMGFGTNARKHLGVCFHSNASSDAHREIFISPSISSTHEILVTLAHELCHASLPEGVGHGAPFKQLAYAIGLTGKATETPAGPAFKIWISKFVEDAGEYPGGSINLRERVGKQQTAMIKCECGTCGYICRTTEKWLKKVGAPHCPKHGEMDVY